MDSKQLALIYLTDEANRMAGVCTKNVHILNQKRINNDLAEQLGKLFSAMREVATEFKLDEQQVENFAIQEYERRQKDY
jgi:cob(I)alamin adenosyltransferase